MAVTQPTSPARRTFLHDSWRWLRLLLLGGVLYPLFDFLNFRVPRQPREVIVPKKVKVGGSFTGADFVLFQGEDKAWAVSRTCTHLGCSLNFNEKQQLLICPCHQSQFTPKGVRVAGPAQKNLPVYQVKPMPEGQGYVVVL